MKTKLMEININYYFVLFVAVTSLIVGLFLLRFSQNWEFIKSDGLGYYIYLPSVFEFDSLEHSTALEDYLVQSENEEYKEQGMPDEYVGIYKLENGNYMSKYPPGVAIMQSPFYLMARVLDGGGNNYSDIYQISNLISSIFYGTLGLFLIVKILLARFTTKVTLAVLFTLVAGTNLMHYMVFDSSFSHMYALFLVSFIFFVCDRWERLDVKNYFDLVLIGFSIGLIVLVRNTYLIIGILPFFVVLKSSLSGNSISKILESRKEDLKNLIIQLSKRFLTILIPFLLTVAPLAIFWKIVSGDFIVNSYGEEGFYFLNPQFLSVLFDIRSGLLFWHPLFIFSALGLIIGYKKYGLGKSISFVSLSIVLLLQLYIIASWWAWWFGFSYGHRGFTDLYLVFAIGFGFLFKYIFEKRKTYLNVLVALIFSALFLLNGVQMYQYWRGIVAPHNISMERYREFFMRPCINTPIPYTSCDESFEKFGR